MRFARIGEVLAPVLFEEVCGMDETARRRVLQRELRGEQLTVLRGRDDWQVCLGESEHVGRWVVPLLQDVIGSNSESLAITLDVLQWQDDADRPLTRER